MTDIKLRRYLTAFSLIILICGLYAYYKPCTLFVNSLIPRRTSDTIVIDPGHGGYDPGKVGSDGTLEKDINLLIALQLKDFLEKMGYNVKMTRSSDVDLSSPNCSRKKTDDLNNRIKIINEADPLFVISIHQNSFQDSSVSGAQVFYYGNSGSANSGTSGGSSSDDTSASGSGGISSQVLAETLQAKLIENADANNHRAAKSNTSYYMLKNTACPIVIIECGFLSNPAELSLLKTSDYQKKIAQAIALGADACAKSN